MMLQEMADEMNCCVLALSQLSRQEPGTDPTMRDLRDSGNLEQEAHVVVLLKREGYGQQPPPPSNTYDDCKLIIDKNRNGNRGIVKLGFLPFCCRFRDYEGGTR
jgi:replicative DNA helicase